MKIKFIERKEILATQLSIHPDAGLPIAENDKQAMRDSLVESEMHTALRVVVDGDGYQVIDGCNRLTLGIEQGKESFDCEVVECDNVREFVIDNLIARRRGSTSQRILAYVQLHKDEVFESLVQFGGKLKNLKNPSVSPTVTDVTGENFTVAALAKKFRCNKADIAAAVELLKDLESPVALLRAPAEEAYTAIMQGDLGLRGWKSALPGKAAEQHGKASADYARLAGSTCITMTKVFENWGKIAWNPKDKRKTREWALDKAFAMFSVMPNELRAANAQAIVEKWELHEKKALKKALLKVLKAKPKKG